MTSNSYGGKNMTSLDQIAVDSRRKGIVSSTLSDMLYDENPNAEIEDVVHAFALAGYPPFDNLLGSRSYSMRRGDWNQAMDDRIVAKLRDVKYPENEIQEALHRVVG